MKRFRTHSLTKRIIIYVMLVNLVFWTIACVMAAFVMYNEYGESFDGTLQVTAERLLPLALSDVRNNHTESNLLVEIDNHSTPSEYTTYQVFDRNGNIVMRSSDAPDKAYGVPLETGFFKTNKYRIYSLKSSDSTYFIQVADKLAERREAAREAMTAMLIPALLLIPLSILAIAWLLRRQLSPITELSHTIAKKDTGDMEKIDQRNMPKEFEPIIQSVNNLLDRLKSALDAERSFTSNSAHEIRTPIAAALAHTQVLLDEIPKQYHKRAKEVEGSLQRLRRLSEKLLQLARADAQVGISDRPVDLLPFVHAVVEDFQRMPDYRNRLNVVIKTSTINYNINGDTFGIVLRNLIENALNYSPKDSCVDVIATGNLVTVINDCPPVSKDQIKLFHQRFYRGQDNKEGSGLGLSIVNALAQSMHITVEYISPVPHSKRGFQACIILKA